jgi:drug/metabolite transporter (DMT)-like permease
MTGTVVVLAALGSALAAAASTVLQHRAARRAPHGEPGRLLPHLLANRMWIIGLLAGTAGLALHVVALSAGRLVVVQPLLMSGILFALPLSVALEGRRPAMPEWLLALLLVTALAVFLSTATPVATAAPAGTLRLGAVLTLAVMAGLTVGGRRASRPERSAALLGTAAGIGFGLTAALLKQATTAASVSPAALARDWSPYAVAVIGALTIAVTQLAYRAGPLAASLPALTIGDPIAAVALGVLALGERLDDRPVPLAAAATALAVMVAAAAVLARRSAASAATQAVPPDVSKRPVELHGPRAPR